MPGMDGLELAQRLRALPDGPRTKLIAMSASVLSFNRDDAFAAGCDDFLPKPFREDRPARRLFDAAQRGEIMTLRRRVAELQASHPGFTRELEPLLASYRLEDVRARLAALLR
jgi:CheY-like chemotaxis protein